MFLDHLRAPRQVRPMNSLAPTFHSAPEIGHKFWKVTQVSFHDPYQYDQDGGIYQKAVDADEEAIFEIGCMCGRGFMG